MLRESDHRQGDVALYGRYCRPGLVRRLEAVGLDALYERAEGDTLWRRQDGTLVEVLDLVGGFGVNLFGHHHPELAAEARRLLEARVPIMAQGSCRPGAARLAQALCERLGDYVVTFTNSGAETIEAALKHAHLERERLVFWGLKHGFHGKTNGAVQLTWTYGEPFAGLGPRVRFLDPWAPATWAEAEAGIDEIAAAFIEPVLGEGGVRPLPPEFVAWLTRTCRAHAIPLVVDEIQTGMGRTGTFLASEALGIEPDYLCLSKALGGGLAKIGALLIRRERFIEDFSIKHTSTFAEDDLSCFLALKALEILERDDLPGRCAARGAQLLADLEALRARFPEVIREVRGRGLMVGVELQPQGDSPSYSLRLLSDQGFLGYLAMTYLLNVHRIRVAPTLSQPFTIRAEPSAYVTEAALARFVGALATFCEAVRALDIVHLTSYLVKRQGGPIIDYSGRPPLRKEAPQTPHRTAFLAHLVLPEHIALWDPALQALSREEVDSFISDTLRLFSPQIFDEAHVRSQTGEQVHLSWIDLYLTSEQIVRVWERGEAGWIRDQIEEAVGVARDAGCRVVGLGGYTSILMGNGLRVRTNGVALTSGNALTIGMGVLALKKAAQEQGIELASARLGILGASGNIGQTYALMMAPHVAELVLIVRNPNTAKVSTFVEEVRRAAPGVALQVTDQVSSLRGCSLIVAASSAAGPLIFPEHLAEGPVVICDLSLPADVDASVLEQRPDVLVINGGIVRLPPGNGDLRIGGLALDPGHIYACIGETLLMGLEGVTTHGSYGPVRPEQVEWTLRVAEKHGFVLGPLKKERFTA